MGLFDWVDDILTAPVTMMTGGAVTPGSIATMMEGEQEEPGVSIPGEDPKLAYSRALQKRVAKDFRDNLDTNVKEGTANIRARGQAELDEENRGIDRGMNRRGLLYSGKRQGAREVAAANKANQVGAQAGEYETAQRDLARDLDSDVINSDLQSVANQSDYGQMISDQKVKEYSRALQKRMQGNQAMGQLGQGAGRIGGLIAGGAF